MKRFKKAYIEITNVCNLNCTFCPKTKREKSYITLNNYKHVINEIKPYVNFIYLHLMGEPLLHSDLKSILKISEEEKMKINITTNGTLLNSKLSDILDSKSVRKVSVSVHSFEANDNNNFDEYIENIINASKKLSEKNVTVVLKLWNLDSTNKDVKDYQGKNNMNSNILKLLISKLTDNYNEDKFNKIINELNERNTCEVNKHIYLQYGEKFEWPVNNNEKDFEKIFCYGSVDQFGVLVDGTVTACCLDSEGEINFGNIYEKSFKEIIQSEKFITFNKNIKEGLCASSLCSRCTYARKKV